MRIKTFEAPTMQQALLQARNELGEDAVVLNTRHVKTGGILGIGGADRVELMAAIDENSQPKAATAVLERLVSDEPVKFEPVPRQEQETPKAVFDSIRQPSLTSLPERPAEENSDLSKLQSEVKQLNSLVQSLLSGNVQAKKTETGLLAALGVTDSAAQMLPSDLSTISDAEQLCKKLADSLTPFAKPLTLQAREIIAIVGPTGVGKTTTLAKLAAYFSLELGKSVAMVTADTFRIGAVEQLRTYARIMGIPLEIAMSPEEMAEGIDKHSDKEIILIDTVGRSQRSPQHIEELQSFVKAAKPTQTHLVVSASAAPEIQEEIVSTFSGLAPTHLIVTKLDESPNRGCLVNLPAFTGIGVSCMTMGQNVPQDIEFATPSCMAARITEVA